MYSQILRDILMEYEKKDKTVYEQKLRTEKS